MSILTRLVGRLKRRSDADPSEEPVTCLGCGRPVGQPGDVCDSCGTTEDPHGGLY